MITQVHFEHLNENSIIKYKLLYEIYIVTYGPITMQRLGKHIPVGANARNNRTSTSRTRISKHASLTIRTTFSAWFVQSGYR
jgi:hypothetical protein